MKCRFKDTYTATIYIAGDTKDAERICRQFCMEHGFCVTVTPTVYVYTGGAEAGVIVGCINYPRFPLSSVSLFAKAEMLAEMLKTGLFQHSYTIVTPDKTVWVSGREE